jgi:hypothetical protein
VEAIRLTNQHLRRSPLLRYMISSLVTTPLSLSSLWKLSQTRVGFGFCLLSQLLGFPNTFKILGKSERFCRNGEVKKQEQKPKHRILTRELKIQRCNPSQMWSMGGSNGTIAWEEVRNIPLIFSDGIMAGCGCQNFVV